MLPKRAQDAAMGARKTADDLAIEERIRAHLRQQMFKRQINMSEAAERADYDNGAFSRVLNGKRGIGLGLVRKIIHGFGINALRLLEEDPPEPFFRVGSHEPPPNEKSPDIARKRKRAPPPGV